MKKQTTDKTREEELEKEIFKEKARQLPYNDSLGYLEEELKGFKQGYANAIADLRQEAIKWIKALCESDAQCNKDISIWIKHFFNITEEELKSGEGK